MNKFLSTIFIGGLFLSLGANEYFVANDKMVFAKQAPNDTSEILGHYLKGDIVEAIDSNNTILNDKQNVNQWIKTTKGFVNAKALVGDKDLPKFIEYPEVNKNQYAIQVITYNAGVVQSLYKIRDVLRNEQNIYLEKRETVYMVYLVNIKTKKEAKSKLKKMKRYFRSAHMSTINYIPSDYIKKDIVIETYKKEDKKLNKIEKIEKVEAMPVVIEKPKQIVLPITRTDDNIKVITSVEEVNSTKSKKTIEIPKTEKKKNIDIVIENMLMDL